ncbi:MAG: hypothetical protein M4579_005759 [Chaenotheca gracillima]|nr:MAG: hypothetical protein M4579_005759 [Chaenotheca gracillima]
MPFSADSEKPEVISTWLAATLASKTTSGGIDSDGSPHSATVIAAAKDEEPGSTKFLSSWTDEQRTFISAMTDRAKDESTRHPRGLAEQMTRVFPSVIPKCPEPLDKALWRQIWLARIEVAIRGHLHIWASRHAYGDPGKNDCSHFPWGDLV